MDKYKGFPIGDRVIGDWFEDLFETGYGNLPPPFSIEELSHVNPPQKMIYTSYFAGLRYLPESIVPIAISRGVPDWFKGERYSKLAPPWDLVQNYKRTGNTHFYTIQYSLVLKKLNIHEVVADLNEIAEGRSFALICFEKPSNFCHRHLVADWLNKNGYPCNEWRGSINSALKEY